MLPDQAKVKIWVKANISAGVLSGLVGYGLLWFTNLANNFPHGWGWIWFFLFLGGLLGGLPLLEKSFRAAVVLLVVSALGVALVIVGILERPFDDKLVSWTVDTPWVHLVILSFAVSGMLGYRKLCSGESPNNQRMRWLVKVTTAIVTIGGTLLGLLAGLLGIQTVPPTLW